MAAGAHQHGNLAGFQRAAADFQAALLRLLQPRGDFGGTPFGGALIKRIGVFPAFAFVEPAQAHGRIGRLETVFVTRGINRLVVDFRQPERLFAGKQAADAFDQAAVAAAVGTERVAGAGIIGGLQIGKDVGAAKAVNRLLGIAHQKQRRAGLGKRALENAVLQRVGVLKFVDQRHPPFGRHRLRQLAGVAVFRLQGAGNVEQQIIETALGIVGLGRFARLPHFSQQIKLQSDQRGGSFRSGGRGGIKQRGQRRQRVDGTIGCGGALFQPFFQRFGAKGIAAGAVGQRFSQQRWRGWAVRCRPAKQAVEFAAVGRLPVNIAV